RVEVRIGSTQGDNDGRVKSRGHRLCKCYRRAVRNDVDRDRTRIAVNLAVVDLECETVGTDKIWIWRVGYAWRRSGQFSTGRLRKNREGQSIEVRVIAGQEQAETFVFRHGLRLSQSDRRTIR